MSFFPCGDEYRPGYRPLPTPIKKPGPGGGDLIAIPPDDPVPPRIIPPHEERQPVPLDPSPGTPTPGRPTGDETPYNLFKCEETIIYCPSPNSNVIRRVNRRCVASPPIVGLPSPQIAAQYPFRTLQNCQASCAGDTGDRPCPPGGPTTGSPRGVEPYTKWGCFRTPIFCPDNETIKNYRRQCRSISLTTFPPPPPIAADYPHDTLEQCQLTDCAPTSDQQCPPEYGDTRIYAIPPIPPTRDNPVGLEPPPDITLPTDPRRLLDVDRTTSINTGTISLRDRLTFGIVNPINVDEGTNTSKITGISTLRDSRGGSLFLSQNFSSSSLNQMYDNIRNIFNYTGRVRASSVANTKHLNVFGKSIATEIGYILNNYDSSSLWKEKHILTLTLDKIYDSLTTPLKVAIDNILDVDGRKIKKEIFLRGIFNHIINNTVDSIDVNYYINLSNQTPNRSQLTLGSTDLNGNPKKVLDFVQGRMQSADPNRYKEDQHKIEVARLKFLPTDIKAKISVETVASATYTVGLEDAGIAFVNPSAVVDHVPLGAGDGYYITLETSSGEMPIELDTSLSASYYLPLADRKIALNLLNQPATINFFVSSTFLNSELSSGYQESFTASAQYFKLDLASIRNNIKPGLFINQVEANYVKLSASADITEHSKTYGAKAVKLNVPYDDPFFQYADVEGLVRLAMNEITFQEADENESPSGRNIILRSIPDAIIIYPAKTTAENPFNAKSVITNITDTHVVRYLETTTNINATTENLLNRPSLPYKFTFDYLNTFKVGLVGLTDTQNIVYVYDSNDFPVSYQVSGRSAVGKVIYDVLENRLNKRYSFTYLTWWDLYRRLNKKDFTKFIFTAPEFLLNQMAVSWRGYQFKNVLYRGPNQAPNNLTVIDPNIDDPIILSETIDRFL